MNRKTVAWLYEQLPELVAQGVIPAETAERIRRHYGPLSNGLGGRNGLTAFGIVGAALVGLGCILIIGHNWDQLSHAYRAMIALGLLLAGQLAAGAVLWFKREQSAWRESGAVFWLLTVGAAIALIGQTYHLVDDFSGFLLIWMLLALPVVYLMTATAAAVLYLAGISAWLASGYVDGSAKQWIWVLLALILPHYWRLLRSGRHANGVVIFSWAIVACFYLCFSLAMDRYTAHLTPLIYGALFSLTFFAGVLWFDGGDEIKSWRQPLRNVGLAGGLGLAYILSFRDVWEYWGRHLRDSGVSSGEQMLTAALLTAVAALAIASWRRKRRQCLVWGGGTAVIGAGYLLSLASPAGLGPVILVNLYLLALGIGVIRAGIRRMALGLVNAGMLMLATLILLRFFDASFSFVTRGLIFVALGVCFLAANVIMARRRREVTK